MNELLVVAGWLLAGVFCALWYTTRERIEDVRVSAEERVQDVKDYMAALHTYIEREAFEERTAEAVETEIDPEAQAQAAVDESDAAKVAAKIQELAKQSGRNVSDSDAMEEARRVLKRHRQRTPPPF